MTDVNSNVGALKLKSTSDLMDVKKSVDKRKLSLTPRPSSTRKQHKQIKEEPKELLESHTIEILEGTPPAIMKTETNTRNLRSASKKTTNQATSAIKTTGRKTTGSKMKSSATAQVDEIATPATINKRKGRIPKRTAFKKKQTPANQKCIDSFFQSCTKTHSVDTSSKSKLQISRQKTTAKTAPAKKTKNGQNSSVKKESTQNKKNTRRGRKRLFVENSETNQSTPAGTKLKAKKLGEAVDVNKKELTDTSIEIINLCDLSDTEEEQAKMETLNLTSTKMTKISDVQSRPSNSLSCMSQAPEQNRLDVELMFCERNVPSSEDIHNIDEEHSLPGSVHCFKAEKPCPTYKIIEDTTFAVDAFRFGQIEKVTHYFLTHFHADHYIGLTKKFSMPLYLSQLTARLVREFIGVDDCYLHEIELNQPITVNDIEITAIDAHHCPGAVMFVFKLPNGKCLLHTGDFRACSNMESEPIFWNNDIDTIYLDTTYMPTQYAFCTQYESIERAKQIMREFNKRHLAKRILYVCGSYLIGKEKFWSALAEEFSLKVWCEENRRKSITAMQLPKLLKLKWVDQDEDADLHIIPMAKLNYPLLQEYFHSFHGKYDVILAFRPSGWEKNSRPRLSGQINLVGVEYSEHSSYTELERFVKYLKPRKVISTVPLGRNLFETAVVPKRWYQYKKLTGKTQNYQPSISNYLTPLKVCLKSNKGAVPMANFAQDDQENSQKVSPCKSSPLRCVGASAAKHNGSEDACNDWFQ